MGVRGQERVGGGEEKVGFYRIHSLFLQHMYQIIHSFFVQLVNLDVVLVCLKNLWRHLMEMFLWLLKPQAYICMFSPFLIFFPQSFFALVTPHHFSMKQKTLGKLFVSDVTEGQMAEMFFSLEEGITCPAPLVANSVMIGGEVPPYQVGHKVTFTCRPGFHLTGSEHITCGSLGMWQPKLPRCILLPMSTEEPFYDVERRFFVFFFAFLLYLEIPGLILNGNCSYQSLLQGAVRGQQQSKTPMQTLQRSTWWGRPFHLVTKSSTCVMLDMLQQGAAATAPVGTESGQDCSWDVNVSYITISRT